MTLTGALNILIGGEAGQGLVTIGGLLAKALIREGFDVVVTQGYQSRIRGGHNSFEIYFAQSEIYSPAEKVDLLVALDEETIEIHKNSLSENALIIADQSHLKSLKGLGIPYKDISSQRNTNIVAFGVVCSLLGIGKGTALDIFESTFGKKDPEVLKNNEGAFNSAYDWTVSKAIKFNHPNAPSGKSKRLMLNGNDAIALGAMSAGIKFFSFYPMTPSTSVGLTLAANAGKMGMVVEQAEDEIAVINMAIGASYAGAPSMVATSGGGFALMVEGVSLAAMTETPIVIMVGQRPAPATGLPTRTEQGDLEFVLHCGHGEFGRAIFAPASVEECFFLTRRAFELAEKFQGPVFILSDQFLADSFRAVLPFDVAGLPPITAGASSWSGDEVYKRFHLSENGISLRLLPGLSEHLVVVDSDEHTEDGHLTEDLHIRKLMVEKRLKKLEGLKKEVTAPKYLGSDKPDILFVTWGSSFGAVYDSTRILQEKKIDCAVLSFSQIWPIVPDNFLHHLKNARQVIGVEGNATAQFARLIKRECGFEINKNILRYDGLPITAQYIVDKLEKM